MKAKLSKIAVGLAVLMGVALFPQFASAQCDFHHIVADGRISPSFTISSGTNDMNFFFLGVQGRSYSVEAVTVGRSYSAGTVSANWGNVSTDCPNSNIAGLRMTNTFEPGTQPVGLHFFRASFTAPATGYYSLRVGNTSATSNQVVASASDTTQYNPLWSTSGGFETFYRFMNTINAACNVTLTMRNNAGALVGGTPVTINIPANSTAATRNTGPGDLNVADGQAGSATITHDCPPGAIQVDGFSGIFGATTAVLPIKIVAARETVH